MEQLKEAGYEEGEDFFVNTTEEGTVEISLTDAAKAALAVIVMPTHVSFTNLEATATERGIYFNGSVLSNISGQDAQYEIDINEKINGITLKKNFKYSGSSWMRWNTTYPLVDAGKVYDFTVTIRWNSNVVESYNLSIKATGGLGEYYITNTDEVKCVMNGRTIQKAATPVFVENEKVSKLVQRIGTNYNLYQATPESDWYNWLIAPLIWEDEVPGAVFSIPNLQEITGWRNYDYIDAALSGHLVMYSTETVLEIAGTSEGNDDVKFWMNDFNNKVEEWGGKPYKAFVGVKTSYRVGSEYNPETDMNEDVVLPVTNLDGEKYYINGEEYIGKMIEIGEIVSQPYMLPKVAGYRFVNWSNSFPFNTYPNTKWQGGMYFVEISTTKDGKNSEKVFLNELTPNFSKVKVSNTYNKIVYAPHGDLSGTEVVELKAMAPENQITITKTIEDEETFNTFLVDVLKECSDIIFVQTLPADRSAASEKDASTQVVKIIDDIADIIGNKELVDLVTKGTLPSKDLNYSEEINVSDLNYKEVMNVYYEVYKETFNKFADKEAKLMTFDEFFPNNDKMCSIFADDVMLRKLYAKVDASYEKATHYVEANEIATAVIEAQNIEKIYEREMNKTNVSFPVKYAAVLMNLNSCAGYNADDYKNGINYYPAASSAADVELRLNVVTKEGVGGYITAKLSGGATTELLKIIENQRNYSKYSTEAYLSMLLANVKLDISISDGTDETFARTYTGIEVYNLVMEAGNKVWGSNNQTH